MAIAETAAALNSLKLVFDMAKGIQALHTSTEVKQAIANMLDQLITARTQAFNAAQAEEALLKQISDLEAEINRLKAWDGEKQRYQLKRFVPGAFAYALKPEMAAGDPPHNLCERCYQQGEKALLHAVRPEGRGDLHRCLSCNAEIVLGEEIEGPIPPAPSRPTPRVIRYPDKGIA